MAPIKTRTIVPLFAILLLAACASQQADSQKTVRLCTADGGCSEQPRNVATFQAIDPKLAEEERKIEALAQLAEKDPRAAFDLGLRFYRGDGIQRNPHRAISWMREAAEKGHTEAQLALGRLYLSGLEEMGPDPAEAESWLSQAASKGNAEAKRLLATAKKAVAEEREYQRWRQSNRETWLNYWVVGYPYYTYWSYGGWHFR